MRIPNRRLIHDWTTANARARESYLRRHGANETPPPDIRVVTRAELFRERRTNA